MKQSIESQATGEDLLDQFALAVLKGATARLGLATQKSRLARKDIARRCYLMANAMMQERERWLSDSSQQ